MRTEKILVEFYVFRIIERPSVEAVVAENSAEDVEISDCRTTSSHVTSQVGQGQGRDVFFLRFLASSEEIML